MRQGLLAGLIVVAFGLPLALAADGKEFVREFGALRFAASGDLGPFKAIWMKPATPLATVVDRDGALGELQRWAARQTAGAEAHPMMVHTVDAPERDLVADLQFLVGSIAADSETEVPVPMVPSFGAKLFAASPEASRKDIPPVFAMGDVGRPHSRLANFIDAFSIAAHAEEVTPRRAHPAAAAPRASEAVADAPNSAGSAEAFSIIADASHEAGGQASGFVDVVETASVTPPVETAPDTGFVELGVVAK